MFDSASRISLAFYVTCKHEGITQIKFSIVITIDPASVHMHSKTIFVWTA